VKIERFEEIHAWQAARELTNAVYQARVTVTDLRASA